MASVYSVQWMCEATAEAPEPAARISRDSMAAAPAADKKQKKPAEEPRGAPPSLCSPTNSCGYTSGSESEVADSEGEAAAAHRRMRTKFTAGQIHKLEKTFSKHRYLGATHRRRIAEKLHLSETQVKTWFQNRRMKLKREVQDMSTRYWSSALPHVVPPPRVFSAQQHAFHAERLAAAAHALHAPLGPQFFAPRVVPRVQPPIFPPCFY